MTRTLKFLLFALLFAAPVTAQPIRQGGQPRSVGFDGHVRPMQTRAPRAAGKTTFAPGDKFGIFAAAAASNVAPEDIPFDGSMFMYNLPVTSEAGGWSYGNPKFWPSMQELAIYAYYPYDAALAVTGNNASAKGAPVITYTTPTSVADQCDLLYISRFGLTASASAIALPFKHALAQVRILVNLAGGAVGQDIVLESVSISSVPTDRGRLNLGTGVWTPAASASALQTVYSASALPQVAVPPDGLTYLDALGAENPGFFFIPQSCEQVEITIFFHLTSDMQPLSRRITIPSGSWVAGKVYNYHLSIKELN